MFNDFLQVVVSFYGGIMKYTAKNYEKKECCSKNVDQEKTQSLKNVAGNDSQVEINFLM